MFKLIGIFGAASFHLFYAKNI